MADDDAVLIAACDAARAAVAAYTAEAAKDEPGDLLALFARERLTVEGVSATSARTWAGVAAKAGLLDFYAWATGGAELSPEIVALSVTLAEDALALVRQLMGEVPHAPRT